MGLRMQPRSEKFFTLISKAGPNIVESAARALGGVRGLLLAVETDRKTPPPPPWVLRGCLRTPSRLVGRLPAPRIPGAPRGCAELSRIIHEGS
jgi:hypothetical protein